MDFKRAQRASNDCTLLITLKQARTCTETALPSQVEAEAWRDSPQTSVSDTLDADRESVASWDAPAVPPCILGGS